MPVSKRPRGWTGWYRPPGGGQWQALVSGGTEDAAWRALLDAADRAGLGGGLAVLPEGKRPAGIMQVAAGTTV
jgi:hypothetical protein